MGEFAIVAKFGDHVLRRLASSLSNVIRQAGRHADKNSSKGDFFLEFSYLAFGNFLTLYSAVVVLFSCKIFIGCFLWAAVLGASATFGWIPTKQYYCTV